MRFRTLKAMIPFIVLFLLGSLLWRELFSATPSHEPSAYAGESLPSINLPSLFAHGSSLTNQSMTGHVSLLNIWASWCGVCRREHAMLMHIRQAYHIPIYGIAYHDQPERARQYLENAGNPYRIVGNDENGETGIELGIYGTPETFILNKQGRVVYRHVGLISQYTWDTVLYPIIKRYESSE